MMKTLLALAVLGCTGAAAVVPKAKLHYFDVRGLGQAVRYLFADQGIELTEVRHTKDTWPEAKKVGMESGLFTFGQMPALEYWDANGEKTTLVQSVAIMQFLGRELNLYGSSNKEMAWVDVIIGGTGDVRKRYSKFAYTKGAATDEALQAEYKKELEVWVPHFEKALAKISGPYILGHKLSIADYLLFDLVETTVLRVEPKALDKAPLLAAHQALFAARPGIAAYHKSDKHHKFANGASASWDNADNVPAHLRDEKEEL